MFTRINMNYIQLVVTLTLSLSAAELSAKHPVRIGLAVEVRPFGFVYPCCIAR